MLGVHVTASAPPSSHIGQAVVHPVFADVFIEMVQLPSLAEAYKYAAYDRLGQPGKSR